MNFTAVRGFNAYAQISAKVREAAIAGSEVSDASEPKQGDSLSVFGEPVDIVTISKRAQGASAKLAEVRENASQDAPDAARQDPAYSKFREWLRLARPSGLTSGSFTQKVPGKVMNSALEGSGISVGDDEEYDVSVNPLSALTVSSKNAEKAKAIQDLMSSTPMGINWGLLLATLPPR